MKTGEGFHEENLEVLTSQNHWKGTLQIWFLRSDDCWSSVTLRFLCTLPVGWINDDTTVIPGLDPALHVNLPVFIYASFIVKTQHHVFAGQRTCWSISRVAWNVSTLHCLKCDLCLIIKPTLQLTSKHPNKSSPNGYGFAPWICIWRPSSRAVFCFNLFPSICCKMSAYS